MKTPETSKLFLKREDPESGAVYYILNEQLAPYQRGFYFVNNSMTSDGRYLWFVVHYPPLDQTINHLAYIDFETDEAVVCHDTTAGAAYIDPVDGTAYFIYNSVLYRRRPGKDERTELLHRIPTRGIARSCATHLTLTPDGKKFFLDINSGIDNHYCGTLDLETGEFEHWADAPFYTDHGQMNPVRDDFALCAYDNGPNIETGKPVKCPCDENGVYQRLWTVTRDGVRTCYPPLNNYATHEWWSADGKWLYYCNQLGICGIHMETGEHKVVHPCRPWHGFSNHDDTMFTFDQMVRDRYQDWYRGCAASVHFWNVKTDREVRIVTRMPEYCEPGDYFPYHLDPHPRFTQNEKYIVFTTSERGRPDLAIAPVAPLLKMTEN